MRRNVDLEAAIVAKYVVLDPVLDERSRRLWAAAESRAIGFGGDALVSSATGLARQTIRRGRGSNGYRCRAWKMQLQRLADDLQMRVRVSHFPPGTSKWNKVQCFCHPSRNAGQSPQDTATEPESEGGGPAEVESLRNPPLDHPGRWLDACR
jgi:Rhodopirellula transposase DDE domain